MRLVDILALTQHRCDAVAEWLRRRTPDPMGIARAGSIPVRVDKFLEHFLLKFLSKMSIDSKTIHFVQKFSTSEFEGSIPVQIQNTETHSSKIRWQ